MPRPVVYHPLRNWQDFEDLCLDLWRRLWNDPEAQKNGRSGQPQAGVDVFGRPDRGTEWAGVQCKRFDEGNLTPKVVEEEVTKARTFEPALSRYVIATTAPSDVHCQKAARKITDDGFPVTVVSWEEICHYLEDHPDLVKKYFGVPGRATYPCKVARPDGFIPRQELDQICEILCRSGTPAVGITMALRGVGGFGKTTVAQALCHDDRVRAVYPDGILWTTIGEQASEADRVSRILDLLRWWTDAEPPHFDSPRDAGDYLRKILGEQKVLVVVDDVWSPTDVEPFRGAGAGLLVTTRMHETLPAGCIAVKVDAMRLAEAVELLAADLPGVDGLRPRFESLAKKLGEWPLLLKLVNGTLREFMSASLGIPEALDEVEGYLLSDAGLEAFDQQSSGQRERVVSHTIELSLGQLTGEEPRKYEALAIFPEDEDVPLSMVERLWACSAPAAKQLARRLYRLSLLRDLDLSAGTLRLHDVLRKYLIGCHREAAAAVHLEFLARSRPPSGNWADLPSSESYLWRWLPYHLVHAEQTETLRDLLLDFRFLAARLWATDVNVVIGGFDHLPEDSNLRTVQSAIRMSAHILVRHPEQLAGQLLGRLPERAEDGEVRAWERLRQEAGAVGKEFFPNGAGLLPRRACLTPASGPLLRTFEGHTGGVYAVVAAGEGRALSGSSDCTLRLWDLATGACLCAFEGHTGSVHAVVAAGEGRALSGSFDRTLRLWDLATGACLRTLEGHTSEVLAVAAAGEDRALSGSSDGTLRLWDLSTGACLRIFETQTRRVTAVAATEEGRAVSGSADGTLLLWDLDSGTRLRTVKAHFSEVLAVAAAGGGRTLSGSKDGPLLLWNLATSVCLRIFGESASDVTAVSATGEGRALSGSSDGTLRLWDLATGACLRTFEGHTSDVTAVSAAGEGRALSGSSDGTLRLWDLAAGTCLRTSEGPGSAVLAVSSAGEGRALSGSFDGALRLWDLATGACLRTFEEQTPGVAAVSAVGEGRALSGSFEGMLQLWNLATGVCLRTFEGQTHGVTAVSAAGDGRALSGSFDGTLRLWDLATGACLRTFEGHTRGVTSVSAAGDDRALSGSSDGTLRLWDLATGACLRTIERHDRMFLAVVAEDRALSSSSDGVLQLVDALLRPFTEHFRMFLAVAAVGNGRALSGSFDGTLHLWDLATGACLRIFEGHRGGVTAVAVAGERWALSGADDSTVRLWDLATGACLSVFTIDNPVTAVAAADRIVIAGDIRGNVHFLDLILPP